jgi:hypothetical protein
MSDRHCLHVYEVRILVYQPPMGRFGSCDKME